MKKTLLLLLLLPVFSYCQNIPLVNGKAEYTNVIEVNSISKTDLYSKVIEWFTYTYNSSKDVIQSKDLNAGIIIGKANTNQLNYKSMGIYKDAGNFNYTISIYIKNNKIKYVINSITYIKGDMQLNSGADLGETFPHNWTGWIADNKETRREWASMRKQANNEFTLIINSLKSHINKPSNLNDW